MKFVAIESHPSYVSQMVDKLRAKFIPFVGRSRDLKIQVLGVMEPNSRWDIRVQMPRNNVLYITLHGVSGGVIRGLDCQTFLNGTRHKMELESKLLPSIDVFLDKLGEHVGYELWGKEIYQKTKKWRDDLLGKRQNANQDF